MKSEDESVDWMKEASIKFSKLNTIEGLTAYENHWNIKELVNRESFIKEAAEYYIKNEGIGTTAVLCYKRSIAREVNEQVSRGWKGRHRC